MTILELVQTARMNDQESFGNIHEHRIEAIVRAALATLEKQIAVVEDGEIVVDGFGKFVIKLREIEKDGACVTRRNIVFRSAIRRKNLKPAKMDDVTIS